MVVEGPYDLPFPNLSKTVCNSVNRVIITPTDKTRRPLKSRNYSDLYHKTRSYYSIDFDSHTILEIINLMGRDRDRSTINRNVNVERFFPPAAPPQNLSIPAEIGDRLLLESEYHYRLRQKPFETGYNISKFATKIVRKNRAGVLALLKAILLL